MEYAVRKGKHHIQVFEILSMVRAMMRVKPTKEICLLKPSLLWHMHAPMSIFVQKIIEATGSQNAPKHW